MGDLPDSSVPGLLEAVLEVLFGGTPDPFGAPGRQDKPRAPAATERARKKRRTQHLLLLRR